MSQATSADDAYTVRVETRTTQPVNRRLRLWAALEGLRLQVALTEALIRGLPTDDEIRARLAGGGTDANASV